MPSDGIYNGLVLFQKQVVFSPPVRLALLRHQGRKD